ncbi:PREDICTED: protein D2-like [Amphimedon queenslandica]|nr:PREDICTED: protein D2-like [Amphimedon queenslandica]|eukprot:XP_003383905.1 PREDICTED: protein D2-like [Amphimedon queenslandica]
MASFADKFRDNGCVPDVVDTVPSAQAQVVYNGKEVECGAVFTPTQVQNPPQITWPAESGALYTLIMTDPDAPSRTDNKFAEWRHWLVYNIQGSDVSTGSTLCEYIGSGPPKGTGLHRYIFLVFKQPGSITPDEPRLGLSTKDRNNTKARDFVSKYNLTGPIAGNMYQAEWDDYVPKLYASLN